MTRDQEPSDYAYTIRDALYNTYEEAESTCVRQSVTIDGKTVIADRLDTDLSNMQGGGRLVIYVIWEPTEQEASE